MVQKASPTPNKLGRRPAFDHETVISGAISAFWAKGFAATTLGDLEEATGVDRSTIYNSFGGKEGIYQSATAAYLDLSEEWLFEPLHEGSAGVSDVVEFLDRLAEMMNSGTNPRGCLVVNDMANDPADDKTEHSATGRYLRRLEQGLRAALERASTLGEINPERNAQRYHLITAAIVGINVVDRSNGAEMEARTLIDGLRSEVACWALPNGPADTAWSQPPAPGPGSAVTPSE